MQYREIVAVTGLSGLYQLLATKSDGAIVRNLADRSTKFISARLHNVTPLESIEVYTTGENVRLHNVFQKMQEQESSVAILDGKKAGNDEVKNYFKTVFPDFDEDRVYVSDMKKMLKWYELLKANDLLHFEAPQEETTEPATEETAPAQEEEKPAKKTAKAKKSADAEGAETATEEKPAKKARAKKAAEATEEGEEKPAKKTAAKKKKTEE